MVALKFWLKCNEFKCIELNNYRFGAIIHEYVGFKRRLNSLINADLCDLERKRPDYIYIKYHIYKESMLLREHEELANKVCPRIASTTSMHYKYLYIYIFVLFLPNSIG